ncbi:MAG TPA: hypothetical protein VH143_17225 [Kofleriaceae bacterium]|nr:hypothetical protein [Kofleriaceae bacterium]
MHVPPWLTIGIAVLVIAFGLYRIRLAFKRSDPDPDKKPLLRGGFYRMNSRTHLLVGVVYLLLGAALIATWFGWSPLGSSAPEPSPSTPKGSVIIAPGSAAR